MVNNTEKRRKAEKKAKIAEKKAEKKSKAAGKVEGGSKTSRLKIGTIKLPAKGTKAAATLNLSKGTATQDSDQGHDQSSTSQSIRSSTSPSPPPRVSPERIDAAKSIWRAGGIKALEESEVWNGGNWKDDLQGYLTAAVGSDDNECVGEEDEEDGNPDLVTEDEEDMDEEEDVENDEDSESDEPYDLEFLVPYDGASESLTFASNTTWSEFRAIMSNKLNILPKNLRLGYSFSSEGKSAAVKHLSEGIHLIQLFSKASTAKELLRKSRKQDKSFSVIIKLLEPKSSDGAAKKSKDKGKDKEKSKKRKRSCQDSDSGSDTDNDSHGKKGMTQWVAQLERDNKCEEHPDNLHGCMKLQDGHVPFTKDLLTGWAMYLQKGYQSTTVPPKVLTGKLMDAAPRTRKLAPQAASVISPSTPTPTPMPAMPMPAVANHGSYPIQYPHPPFGGYNMPHYPYPPPPPPPPPPFGTYPAPSHAPPYWQQTEHHAYRGFDYSSRPPANKRHYIDELPSSDPPDIMESLDLFPSLEAWLQDLDKGPHGRGGHNFASFLPNFLQDKYTHVSDLEDISVDNLLRVCVEMPRRTAEIIQKESSKMIMKIQKDAKARARERR